MHVCSAVAKHMGYTERANVLLAEVDIAAVGEYCNWGTAMAEPWLSKQKFGPSQSLLLQCFRLMRRHKKSVFERTP